jgi:hypothetical protein
MRRLLEKILASQEHFRQKGFQWIAEGRGP